MMTAPWWWAIGIGVFIALYGVVGSSDYDEALLQERMYCQHVADGIWPAYKPEIICE